MRKLAGILFIDFRGWAEAAIVAAVLGGLAIAASSSKFETTLNEATRSTLYVSLAGTGAALLGFVLTALAILVALPSSERMDALKEHPKWDRVPTAYTRASQALLLMVIVCTLGVAVDGGKTSWRLWEFLSAGAVSLALARVTTSLVALDQILAVARAPKVNGQIDDPGP